MTKQTKRQTKKNTTQKRQTKRQTKRQNSNKQHCYKSFCSKLQSLTRRNLTRLKLPVAEIEQGVKNEGKNCKKTFCDDTTCSHAHPFIQQKVVNGFFPGSDVKMLKSLGATSNCGVITHPVIIGENSNRGWSVLLDRSVVAEGKNN